MALDCTVIYYTLYLPACQGGVQPRRARSVLDFWRRGLCLMISAARPLRVFSFSDYVSSYLAGYETVCVKTQSTNLQKANLSLISKGFLQARFEFYATAPTHPPFITF